MIAAVARLLCRELTLGNEYLRLENWVLRSKVRGWIRFSGGFDVALKHAGVEAYRPSIHL